MNVIEERLKRTWNLSRILLIFSAGLLSLATPLTGQSNSLAPQISSPKQFSYDVISVKPHKPGDGNMGWGPRTDGYSGKNIPVQMLVRDAYDIQIEDQMTGFPKWTESARFDFSAKFDAETIAALEKLSHKEQKEQRQLMLQAVLADRFKLKVHHEVQNRPIYELVLLKDSSKLKVSHESENWTQRSGKKIETQAETITTFASILARVSDVGRVVVDKTSLTEEYDIILKWTPEEERGQPDAGPGIFTAIQEQLGLKLKPATDPVNVLVIDHVEAPSSN